MKKDDSGRIVRQCLKGDRKAQKELYDAIGPVLMGLCRRYTQTQEDAEDVLMEAFVQIFTKLDTYRGHSIKELVTWCKSITIYKAIDKINSKKRLKRNGTNFQIETVFDDVPSTPMETSLDAEWILSIMDRMPKKPRLVFNLREIDGYSYEEMSEMLGMSINALKVNYHRARKWLAERLEADSRKADRVH